MSAKFSTLRARPWWVLMFTLCVLLVSIVQPASAQTTTVVSDLVKKAKIIDSAFTWTTTLTASTPISTASCSTVELSFDPSQGDASTDATVDFLTCPSASSVEKECQQVAFARATPTGIERVTRVPVDGTFLSVASPRGYMMVVPRAATTGGDTAIAKVRCHTDDTDASASSCTDGTVCVQLEDANGDGNWLEDWRRTLNQLLYPNGVLNTAESVDIYPPPAGEYFITAGEDENGPLVRACYDTSPPAGGSAAVMDCTGSSASLRTPRIRLLGNWSGVTWHCNYPAGSWDAPTGAQAAACFRFGDVSNDGYIASGVQRLYAPFALNVKSSVGIAFASGVFLLATPVWCDGCSGSFGIRGLEGTYEPFQVSRGAIFAGSGAVGERFDIYINQAASPPNNYHSHLFTGDLRNMVVHGQTALATVAGSINASFVNVDADCTYGTAYTDDTCRGLTYDTDFATTASITMHGSDMRFRGAITGSAGGLFMNARPDCSENYFGANVFEGRASCNDNLVYCVRNSNPANCLNPNPGVFDGYSEQLAADNPNRNSPFLALKGRTILGPRLGYAISSSTAAWLSECHTSIGYVSAAWAVDKEFSLNSYTGPPGSPGTCIKKDGTGLATCGTDATKVYPGVRGYWSGVEARVEVAVPASTHCTITLLKNGSTTKSTGSSGCNSPDPLGTLSWGGTQPYVNSEASRPLRAIGDLAELPVLDRIVPGDYLELRLDNGQPSDCAAGGGTCNCNAVDGLRARMIWFQDPAGN